MPEERMRQIAQEEISKSGDRNTFSVAQVPRHIHNGVDAPFAFEPIVTYIGMVGVPTNSTLVTILVTAPFVGGETSATLSSNWVYGTGIYLAIFDNADERNVTFTRGATTATWTGALSGPASAVMIVDAEDISVNMLPNGWTVRYDDVGAYSIIHNLATQQFSSNISSNEAKPGLYTVVVNAVQSTNVFAVPVISPFANEFSVTFADIATGTRADTGFCFHLTLANNKNPSPPTGYYGTYVT